MPELPEVETIVNDLSLLIVNKFIIQIKIIDHKLINLTTKHNQKLIINQSIKQVYRRAKNIIIHLSNNYRLVIHLKMTGQMIWQGHDRWLAGGHPTNDLSSDIKPTWPNKSTRAIISLSDGSQLFFNDSRRFGWIELMIEKDWLDYQSKLGIEPLSLDFNDKFFKKFFLDRPKSKVKTLLLEQKRLVGLGNIYVDESLFKSAIRPDRLAETLTILEIKNLRKNIINILQQSINQRGTSFSDYRDGRGQIGSFIKQLQVYGRSGKKCLHCNNLIKKIKLNGRGTHFCPNCQK
jgi:formamidopyrimidine-DNA glycosylase